VDRGWLTLFASEDDFRHKTAITAKRIPDGSDFWAELAEPESKCVPYPAFELFFSPQYLLLLPKDQDLIRGIYSPIFASNLDLMILMLGRYS
jgi:hypothetical protein